MCADSIAPWPDFNAIPTDDYVERREVLLSAYRAVREHSRELTIRFREAEQQIQSMPDASPTKWHLAHTTWFFETFLLKPFQTGFEWVNEHYCYLFNSYYNAIGSQYPRPKRGLITDPDLAGVWVYRAQIDNKMGRLLESCDDGVFATLAPVLVLGLNHEQQHQELIFTDIKHALFQCGKMGSEPFLQQKITTSEEYRGEKGSDPISSGWLEFPGGMDEVGFSGDGFCFDNELARHEVLLPLFRISASLVSIGEWLEFMEDGGYNKPLLWLSDGWHWKETNEIEAPLYWRKFDEGWHRFNVRCRSDAPAATNCAWTPIDNSEPVCHISYYEADAFATWRGARLPRETEWEACASRADGAAFSDHGKCWEWTQSAYSAYPGFRPTEGMAGEYNGKFMVSQMVLRGESAVTSAFHSRPSYRNFFYPHARWQYSGLRLARDN